MCTSVFCITPCTYLYGLSFEDSAPSLGSLKWGLYHELVKGMGQIKCSSIKPVWIWLYRLLGPCAVTVLT